jgi:hypothetical protein
VVPVARLGTPSEDIGVGDGLERCEVLADAVHRDCTPEGLGVDAGRGGRRARDKSQLATASAQANDKCLCIGIPRAMR